jgi:hypothetical protein
LLRLPPIGQHRSLTRGCFALHTYDDRESDLHEPRFPHRGPESVDNTLTIVAKRPWTANSDARLVSLTDEYRIPSNVLQEGFEYFLEVSIALDEVLGELASQLTGSTGRSDCLLR